jgi:acetyltransferase-like isoleucine patch superfamily enzyme
MLRLALSMYYVSRLLDRSSRLFWRWTLSAYLKTNCANFGSCRIAGYGRFASVSGLSIGNNVHINIGANWVCEGGLVIGDNVHISSNCTIYTRNHNSRGKALPYDEINVARPVSIGRNSWIGTNVTILPGTQIGNGVIIGAGAIVHGTVPDLEIWGAAKAGKIGERDHQHYEKLEREGRYGGPNGYLIETK